jgi:Holliday junction resolvase RusA-like endonuclease
MSEQIPNSNINLFIPILPPSSNKIYVNKRGGKGRFLSTFANQYKIKVKNHLGENYFTEINILKPETIYEISYIFLFKKEEIYNITYGKPKGAKTKYKKLDVSNRIKLLEDCLTEITGIDDSYFFTLSIKKKVSKNPGVYISLQEMSDSDIWFSE